MRNVLLTTTHLRPVAYNSGDNGTEFSTPLGRIVWGHPLKPQDKTDDNNQKVLGQDGQPIKQWAFGVAFPKAEFEAQIWPHLAAETAKGYPNGVPPKYSYKYKDGDSTDPVWSNGKQQKPYAEREGYAGHYILTFSTEFQPPQCFIFQNNAYMQIDADRLKTGDFVQIGTNVKWHAGQSPGLYVNPLTVLLCFEGDALGGSFNVDPNAMFGAQPNVAQMPQGARAIGAAPQGQQAPGGSMPGMGGGAPQGTPPTPGQGGMPGNAPTPTNGAPTGGGMPGNAGAMPSQAAGSPASGNPPPPPAGPQRPTDPSHVHDNGNGTEQWFVNGAWDGGAHPAGGGAQTLPPPASGFVDRAAQGGMPGAPAAGGGMPGQMPPR